MRRDWLVRDSNTGDILTRATRLEFFDQATCGIFMKHQQNLRSITK